MRASIARTETCEIQAPTLRRRESTRRGERSYAEKYCVCADGTWNGPNADDDNDGVPDTTNVWKLFCTLRGDPTADSALLAEEQEIVEPGDGGQVAKYLHGVGDSRNVIIKLLGGAFGDGIIARIVRGYTYISRNYEPGDSIILIGFSRGAYTARALGGMIADVGLLNANSPNFDLSNKENAYRFGIMAWRKHREARVISRGSATLLDLFNRVADMLPHFAFTQLQPADTIAVDSIKAIGVWDTVGALGIPIYASQSDESIDVFKFADTALNAKVEFGVHAISLDEQRTDFTPTLWDARSGVTQVLFAGAHADVGGGYSAAESGLSDTACDWMLRQLSDPGTVGLHVKPSPWPLKPDWFIVGHEPWKNIPFNVRPTGPRSPIPFPASVGAHVSIAHKMGIDPVTGAPVPVTTPYVPTTLGADLANNRTWVS
jgi:uncharacterized protein (DUF2235 family)